MDDHESKLRQVIDEVSQQIADDVLEGIIQKQQNLLQDNSRRNYNNNIRSVATMTDSNGVACEVDTSKNSNYTQKTAEKQANKKCIAEERRRMQMANKMYKPGECMKHMIVEIHPALSSAWYMADVAREVAAVGAKLHTSTALCNPALVLWSCELATNLAAEDGLMKLSPTREQCDRVLFVTTAEEVSELVAERGLTRHMGHIAELTGCKTTLVVFGVREYFKPSGRKKVNTHGQQMTEVELEMALTDLLVSVGCDAVKVDTPNELALTIVPFTKAIAEAPYKIAKRQCDEQAQFYMRGDNKNCVTVNKNGVGAAKLWQQMLAVLPMSSLERSRALCAQYASPKQLFEELESPGGVDRVADIGVARSAVPGSLARRTGVEFARKLSILFTADDGDSLVQ